MGRHIPQRARQAPRDPDACLNNTRRPSTSATARRSHAPKRTITADAPPGAPATPRRTTTRSPKPSETTEERTHPTNRWIEAKKVGPHTLRHAFITAALDAGVALRDVQEAASHADPRTTMRYDRARVSLDRHATYIVATFIAGAAR